MPTHNSRRFISGPVVRSVATGMILAASLAGCDDGTASSRPTTTPAPISPRATETTLAPTTQPSGVPATKGPPPVPQVPIAEIDLQLIEVANLDAPIAMAVRSGSDELYIAERVGRIQIVRPNSSGLFDVDPTPALDITDLVANLEGERGLLGIAFSPDGTYLFVSYTDGNDAGTSVLARYEMDGLRPMPGTRTELLTVPQPFSNHNGGNLVFGPDGYLYLGFGDGGSQNDPNRNGQDVRTLLGSILRIDVLSDTRGGYTIPADNPFVDDAEARREIWAIGVRNPWRFSFDRSTGDLWIADVGGSNWEEIDLALATEGGGKGLNFGWSEREGAHSTSFGGGPASGAAAGSKAVDPIFEYDHSHGSSITGGYVYRGASIPDLVGTYVYSDFSTNELRAVQATNGELSDSGVLATSGAPVGQVASFGQDADGELYALEITGAVLRIDNAG